MTSKAISLRKSRLNRAVVREKDHGKRKEFLLFFALLILISIPVLLYLWNRIEYVRYQYEIKDLRHRRQVLIKNEDYLETEKSYLESPRLIEEQARRDFSLKAQGEGGCLVVVRIQPERDQRKHLLTEKKNMMEVEPTGLHLNRNQEND